MKYSIISFWPGYNYSNNIFTNLLCKNHELIIYNDDLDDIDFIIIGSFINNNLYNFINKLKCKKILYISEPIEKFNSYNFTFKLYTENMFDIIIGCIDNYINKYKYPLYINYFNYNDPNIYKDINNYVKNCNPNIKNFCCLINTHDQLNTRTSIYNILKDIDNISCPSILFNNCSNEELNSIGNVEYIKKFKFNICAENCTTNIKGYITEKLLNCCLGCAIPIYSGWFDDIDEKIFNRNRILFYDPNNEESINNTYNKVKELMEDNNKLENFYRMDVFMETAYETCNMIHNNLLNMLKNI